MRLDDPTGPDEPSDNVRVIGSRRSDAHLQRAASGWTPREALLFALSCLDDVAYTRAVMLMETEDGRCRTVYSTPNSDVTVSMTARLAHYALTDRSI